MNPSRLVRPTVTRVRAPRVTAELEVESRTIGTATAYTLSTLDVSRSGLLLSWEHVGNVPFIVNTIIEMTIDPAGNWLSEPVACLGKIVRREHSDAAGLTMTQLGVQIVQIDHSDLHAWEGCLSELERQPGLAAVRKAAMV